MADPQGMFFFPGINQPRSCSYTLSHGITPGKFIVEMLPQEDDIQPYGTMRFEYADAEIEWPDCKVDQGSLQRGSGGRIWQIEIFDRRWKWAWGEISGHYNLRETKNNTTKIKEGTEKSPQELCKLCLEAMGEENFDVSKVPDDARPEVNWDVAVPAQSLAELCDLFGCHVVLKLDNSVAILPVGEGEMLPDLPVVLDNSITINPPELPDRLQVRYAPTMYQYDFLLRAVGKDRDGSIKPIEELSYAPDPDADDGGWGTIDLPQFNNIKDEGETTDESDGPPKKRARQLARSTVFRMYQIWKIKGDNGEEEITDCTIDEIEVTSIEQLVLEDEQLDTTTDEEGNDKRRENEVFGIWSTLDARTSNFKNSTDKLLPLVHDKDDDNTNESEKMIYAEGHSLDLKRGIVSFNEYVFERKSKTEGGTLTQTLAPARLILRTAFSLLDKETRAPVREEHGIDNPEPLNTKPRSVKRDDIELKKTAKYTESEDYEFESLEDNESEAQTQADYYIAGLVREYQLTNPQAISYAGLQKVDPDGAIMQVTFKIDLGATTTQASRNNESGHGRKTWSYKESRLFEDVSAMRNDWRASKLLGGDR
jgi:hypothetical protein